jgi:hypothetical protein
MDTPRFSCRASICAGRCFHGAHDEPYTVVVSLTNTPSTLIQNISNGSVRAWAQAVHEIWPTLGRQSGARVLLLFSFSTLPSLCHFLTPVVITPLLAADDAQRYPDRHSLLYTPHGLVVPGGRFREMYYWVSAGRVGPVAAAVAAGTSHLWLCNFLRTRTLSSWVCCGRACRRLPMGF